MKAGTKVARFSGLELLVRAVDVSVLETGAPTVADWREVAIILRGMSILRDYSYDDTHRRVLIHPLALFPRLCEATPWLPSLL